jgi:hypothetical protein
MYRWLSCNYLGGLTNFVHRLIHGLATTFADSGRLIENNGWVVGIGLDLHVDHATTPTLSSHRRHRRKFGLSVPPPGIWQRAADSLIEL